MKPLFTLLFVALLCAGVNAGICHAQGKLQFSVNGKTYYAEQVSAELKKNARREYTLTILARGGGLNEVQLFLFDAMSTMPPLRSDDPPMKLGDYTNDKYAITGGMFNIAFADNTAIMSNEQVKPAFRLTLSKLDVKNGLASGTFEGPMDHITNGKQEQVTGGIFTDVPVKKGY